MNPTDEETSAAPTNPIAFEDYQLFEALNMLKGIHAEKSNGDPLPLATAKPSVLVEKK